MMQDAHARLNPGLPWQKQHSAKRRLFTSKLDLNLGKKLVKCYTWRITVYGAETWTLGKVGNKYLENFEMWCWRKISWTDCVKNEDVVHRAKKERNTLHTIKMRKANWIGHILHRNCLLKHVIEGKTEVIGRWGR
jgi:hypothetical protein